jgi:hypothetical protein
VKTLFLSAALVCVLATPAFAGITCDLNDKKGHSLTYSFTRGGDGYVNEIVVKRDGDIVSNGGPMWSRVSNKTQQSMTLSQGDWSLAYPFDSNKGLAALRQRNTVIATGTCVADYSVDNPAPAPAPDPAPAPYTVPPNTYQAGRDEVPFTYDNGAMFVSASIGGRPVTMQVDTGANVCTIPESLANALIASGQATEIGEGSGELANGSRIAYRRISVSMLVVGNHWGKDINMTVMPSGTPLLSLPILFSSGQGKFTVDGVNRKIIFG